MIAQPRAVIVTGHAQGIGRSVACAAHEAGYQVIGIDCQPSTLDFVEEILCDLGDLVSSSESQDRIGRMIQARLSGHHLSALVNNAALQALGNLEVIPLSEFQRSIEVNALAPLFLARLVKPYLEITRGCLINISSIHVNQTKPGFSPYSVSKATFSAISKSMALEWGDKIKVLEIRPAAIATDMLEAGFERDSAAREKLDRIHPSRKIGQPDELADFIIAMIESKSIFLNGSCINFDGGISSLLADPTNI